MITALTKQYLNDTNETKDKEYFKNSLWFGSRKHCYISLLFVPVNVSVKKMRVKTGKLVGFSPPCVRLMLLVTDSTNCSNVETLDISAQ